ncbi:enoyl-CoA hydratase-related protein [Tabrizicola sp. J26]|uniref:enoyl-CoA hydratase-related protein n=1 Tax=Alitabrizicola rongguiensis TaxID=2909234 RepID=UPI001F29E67F|nr:enoyl-CoA hydratase-related protein [Tabrizicola rongguiensis]MCF1707936.1 enoyl-CoA hydratase-related protein [Tabrizicola rongguiensis]
MSLRLDRPQDWVAELTLDRPEKFNAMRAGDYDLLLSLLEKVEADADVRVLILTGAGRAFCAGTDLSDGFDLPAGGDPATGAGVPPDLGGRVALRLFSFRKPVIAAINGAAIGFGATLTLPCDFRLAVPEARFGFVFSRRGIAADGCSSWFLPRIVGPTKAADWLLTGRMFDAAEAQASGLLTRIAPAEALLKEARLLASDLASNCSPLSLAVNRQLLWQMAGAPHPFLAHQLESRAMVATLAGPDPAEGARAFREKRSPTFRSNAAAAEFIGGWPDFSRAGSD